MANIDISAALDAIAAAHVALDTAVVEVLKLQAAAALPTPPPPFLSGIEEAPPVDPTLGSDTVSPTSDPSTNTAPDTSPDSPEPPAYNPGAAEAPQ